MTPTQSSTNTTGSAAPNLSTPNLGHEAERFTRPTLANLQRMVLENPNNGSYLIQLSEAFEESRVQEIEDFCDAVVDQYLGDANSAELLLSSFKDNYRHDDSHTCKILYRLFSYKFPASSIPKHAYHLQRTDPISAIKFLVDHIRRFCTTSSLIELVEDEMEISKAARLEIWKGVFGVYGDTALKVECGMMDLGRRVRNYFTVRGEIRQLLSLWDRHQRDPKLPLATREFLLFQEALHYLDDGLSSSFVNWVRMTEGHISFPYSEEVFQLGKRLASKDNIALLARCYSAMVEGCYEDDRDRLLWGAAEGFRQAGREYKGMILVALDLNEVHAIHRLLRYMWNWQEK